MGVHSREGLCLCQRVLEINLMSKSSSPAHSYHAPQGCIFKCLSNIHLNCSSPCPFWHSLFILLFPPLLLHRLCPDPLRSLVGCGVPGAWVGCSCGAGGQFWCLGVIIGAWLPIIGFPIIGCLGFPRQSRRRNGTRLPSPRMPACERAWSQGGANVRGRQSSRCQTDEHAGFLMCLWWPRKRHASWG